MACVNCGIDQPNFWLGEPGNRVLLAPDATNDVYIPNQEVGPDLELTGGDGINVAQSGTQGHSATISASVSTAADNALEVDASGDLFVPSAASSPDFTSNNASTFRGIRHTVAGAQGHTITAELVIANDSPVPAGFNAANELTISAPSTVPWTATSGENIVVTPGDNPAGQSGNGHRPQIATRAGSGLPSPAVFEILQNGDGTIQVSIRNPNTGGLLVLGAAF